ncbi:MAG: hypothetical protein QM715_18710 [Nibricoccus sp.]
MNRFFSVLLLALGWLLAAQHAFADERTDGVTINWLGGVAPVVDANVTWGTPWPKGKIQPGTQLNLVSPTGQHVAMQSWPLAYWPDGSVKWSGHAVAVKAGSSGPYKLVPAGDGLVKKEVAPIKCNEETTGISIDTGSLQMRIAREGTAIFETLSIGDRVVAQNGRLIAVREDRSEYSTKHILREEEFTSRVRRVSLEQSGPVRAVVKIEGMHRATEGAREWLPFVVRLYFYAGSTEVRLVHSFVFDGDDRNDFIKGLGLAFTVPFREALHNRHVRFAGEGSGVWEQPIQMVPGYRLRGVPEASDFYQDHLAGERVPENDALPRPVKMALDTMPVWGDAKLTQLGSEGFTISKRTTEASSWLRVTEGRRALGLALLGDVSGGLAVGVKDFWQKYPASLEITGAARQSGELKIWLWSPDGPPMDLRHYDTMPHGLMANYEDWKPGWSTALGVANTHELRLWALDSIPESSRLVAMAQETATPPMLVATPEYYHALQVFGHWSLPDRSTPTLSWIEDQVEGLVDFYRTQVDQRAWYSFWDFGDIMHNYDVGRHEWRYDVGGWAWANTELMPDMLLWVSFLRTGRADLFRFAEAMTRHTSEVDVHHIGPFAPLGSRHNINHWGDGAKQPRISHAGLKRYYYFLSGGDERTGDLLREQIDADLTFTYLQQFNGSHYLPMPDGGYKLDFRADKEAPRPEDFAPRLTAADRKPEARFSLEWMCYALNWTTEWERGGDQSWRARVTTDMKAMAAQADKDGGLGGRYFDMLFGGPENMSALEPMYDVPEFWTAYAKTCATIGQQAEGGQMTAPRLLSYAANRLQDPKLGLEAWKKLVGDIQEPLAAPRTVSNPGVIKPVTDPAFLGRSVGWQLHGVASVHWALNAIETMELARPWLADWEAEHLKNKTTPKTQK